ncbi:nucleoside triphosphate pyrophosphohydrolase family protein [Candidatus Saccharibacteria bacterium]|nr:nucleoside triphosphate pyrophosphohydrolase family protein [Candidatus Saccharibacteria bacterium]
MKFDEYQEQAKRSDTFEPCSLSEVGFTEKVMGLAGEAGEVVDKFKKILRDKNGEISDQDKENIVKELGDVLWYVASIARYMEVPLSEVAEKNIEKLEGRLKRGTVHGAGDER